MLWLINGVMHVNGMVLLQPLPDAENACCGWQAALLVCVRAACRLAGAVSGIAANDSVP